MNKIYPKRNIDLIISEYLKFVEPKVRQRLNVYIGFLLLKKGESINLDSNSFIYDGVTYNIGDNCKEKKVIINSFFSKIGKKDRVKIKSGKLQLPDYKDDSIYKSNISDDTFNSFKFIELSKELEKIIGNKIDISSGSFLEKQKCYCRKLSTNEKLIIDGIFPYKLFFQKKDHDWFYAATLANELNTPVCPYCNREYINSVRTSKGEKIVGPTFDHFLSQKDYPFLKLSFYNLIPSCTTCNSRLKNQKEFDFDYFLYPFEESYETLAEFKLGINYKEIDTRISDSKIINESILTIKLKTKNKHLAKLQGTIPLNQNKGNLNVFQTEKIYNESHKDIAFDVLEKFQRISKSHIESTFKILKEQGKTDNEIYRFYYGNYLNEEDFNKRPLARMTRDITKQLGKVYSIKV